MRNFTAALILVIGSLATTGAWAEDQLSVEVRVASTHATEPIADTDLDPGAGIEGSVAVELLPGVNAYGGWGWHKFPSDHSFLGADTDFIETGYTFGLQFSQPVAGPAGGVSLLVRVCGVLGQLEAQNDAGIVITETDHELGWQVGGGLNMNLTDHLRLIPTVRYRSFPGDIVFKGRNADTDLKYLSFGVGLALAY